MKEFTVESLTKSISTNESAVRLWQRLGFRIVGTLPDAFRHSQKGLVDAYVMFRSLEQA